MLFATATRWRTVAGHALMGLFMPKSYRIAAVAGGLLLLVGSLEGAEEARRWPRGALAVRVNSTASAPALKGTSFHVHSSELANESTLLYSETAGLVKAALRMRGLYDAPRPDHADIRVEIEYTMQQPRAQERPEGEALPNADADPRQRGNRPSETELARMRSDIRVPLEKQLVLTAREGKPKDDLPPRTLWRVELSMTDTSNDFRKYLPMLAAAAINHIGQDSYGALTVPIHEDDKTVALLKKSK